MFIYHEKYIDLEGLFLLLHALHVLHELHGDFLILKRSRLFFTICMLFLFNGKSNLF